MATISIHTNRMAQRMIKIFGWYNETRDDPVLRNTGETYMISSSIGQNNDYPILDSLHDGNHVSGDIGGVFVTAKDSNDNYWIKYQEDFSSRVSLMDWGSPEEVTNNTVVFKNPMLKRSRNYWNYANSIEYKPIIVYSGIFTPTEFIYFVRAEGNSNQKMQYRLIMQLQITQTGGVLDSTYGNLYHLKHLTFTFS